MARCPNCNYLLVLLEYKRKYKCPKCGKLFSQKEIEDKEFREFNKKRRAEAKKEAKKEYRKQYLKENRERINEVHKKYYYAHREKILAYERQRRANLPEKKKEEMKESRKESYEKWKEKNPNHSKDYYKENKAKILSQQRVYKSKSGQEIKSRNKFLRDSNIEAERMRDRLKYWRNQQKNLALENLDFALNEALNPQIPDVLPTLVLSDLLRK